MIRAVELLRVTCAYVIGAKIVLIRHIAMCFATRITVEEYPVGPS